MRFVIDETSWNFDGLEPSLCLEALEEMLDRIDDAQHQGHGCCYSDDLFNMPVRDGRSFYELYSDDTPLQIPPEVRTRIAAAFSRLRTWQELEAPWPVELNAAIAEGGPEFAPSIAWAHAQAIRGAARAVSCISHPIRRVSGPIDVTVAGATAPLWFVSASRDVERFFRWLISEGTDNPDGMEAFSASAFRNLDFVEGAFNGIKSMSKPYRELRTRIVRHLAAFSDEGTRIFSGPWDRVPAEFGPFGVDISDENGTTKSNRRAQIERTRTVNGEMRVFWWHSKLELDRDRIHICPERVRQGGRILVGIFCRHLTL
jgi:hypothetical protein